MRLKQHAQQRSFQSENVAFERQTNFHIRP